LIAAALLRGMSEEEYRWQKAADILMKPKVETYKSYCDEVFTFSRDVF
jgi:hypothetical protein